MEIYSDDYFMNEALKLAQKAYANNEVPVGAVVVINQQIIGKGYNQVELLQDPTAHAELIAITAACNFLGNKYLDQATLYVTLEPCLMCKGALLEAQISQVIYAAKDTSRKKREHQFVQYHNATVNGMASELLVRFFKRKRIL